MNIKLDANIISKNLPQDFVLKIFEKINSTNDYLISHLSDKISICLAEEQTKGRGRLGKPWISPAYQNIYLSIACLFEKDYAKISDLSLMMAKSIIQALKIYGIQESLEIKLPNDILYQKQKLAGILIETKPFKNKLIAIIGIGLNVNMKKDKKLNIDQPWTSLIEMRHQEHNRNQLVIKIIEQIFKKLLENKN